MKPRFIKAKGVYGEFYINVEHIELLFTYKGGNGVIHYQIQYEDCNHTNKLAEISKEDYESLTMSVEEGMKRRAEMIKNFRKDFLGDEKNN